MKSRLLQSESVLLMFLMVGAICLPLFFGCGSDGDDEPSQQQDGNRIGGSIQAGSLSLSGKVSAFVGPAGGQGGTDGIGAAAAFNQPGGVASVGTNLFVADTGNSEIRRVNITTGEVTTFAGDGEQTGSTDGIGPAARFGFPQDIATDGLNLYVSDGFNNTIRAISIADRKVTTIAGTPGISGYFDGTGPAARFVGVTGITTDGVSLFVTERFNHTIRKVVIATGVVTTIAGAAGVPGSADGAGTAARFNQPRGIATDGVNLYVADSGNRIIRRIEISTGRVSTFAGSAGISGTQDGTGTAARFDTPLGLVAYGSSLYVTDAAGAVVRQIELATARVTTVAGAAGQHGDQDGPAAEARCNVPGGIAAYGTSIYFTDANSHTVRKIEMVNKTVSTLAGKAGASGWADDYGPAARFMAPFGIATDGDTLYVADRGNHCIRRINITNGEVNTLAGSPGVAGSGDGTGRTARFSSPADITTDGTSLYVADSGNHTIRKIVPETGEVSTVAGNAGTAGASDGIGTSARLNNPSAITTEGKYVYVSDRGNGSIRRLHILSGEVTTVSKTAGAGGITTDGSSLYIADMSGQSINRLDLSTKTVTVIAGAVGVRGSADGQAGAARFSYPLSVTCDGDNLYIGEAGNHTIRKVAIATGQVSTLAGSPGASGSVDGVGLSARLNEPAGLTTDGVRIYISNRGTSNIRRLE